jgi:hypothetical protein
MSQSGSDREALQAELLAIFERYGLSVAVGITNQGVAIRSQDERVDAANVGDVRPLPLSRDSGSAPE